MKSHEQNNSINLSTFHTQNISISNEWINAYEVDISQAINKEARTGEEAYTAQLARNFRFKKDMTAWHTVFP